MYARRHALIGLPSSRHWTETPLNLLLASLFLIFGSESTRSTRPS